MGSNLIDLPAILEVAAEALTPFADLGPDSKLQPCDLEWEAWPQTWGSTALGYGGIGGQSLCTAQTVVVGSVYCNEVAVFFGGKRLAYIADGGSPGYHHAVQRRKMPPVSQAVEVRK